MQLKPCRFELYCYTVKSINLSVVRMGKSRFGLEAELPMVKNVLFMSLIL